MSLKSTSLNRRVSLAALSLSLFTATAFGPNLVFAQNAPMKAMPASQTDTSAQQAMQGQITALKEQVAKLQGALQQSKGKTAAMNKKGTAGGSQPAMGMEDDSDERGAMRADAAASPMQDDKSEMGTMKSASPKSGMKKGGMAPMQDDKDEIGAMAGSTKGGMAGAKGMAKDGMSMPDAGCCGMGSMGKPMAGPMGVKPPATSGTVPRKNGGSVAPGTSESSPSGTPSLMHLGAKDFFIDHARHIALTPEQTASLHRIKADAAQQRTTSQMQIEKAQQELWQLTDASQPNSDQIDEKVQQIAKLRADQQTTYLHSVSDAAKVLTPEQQDAIVKPSQAAPMKM